MEAPSAGKLAGDRNLVNTAMTSSDPTGSF